MPEKISGITFYLLGDSQSLKKHSDGNANQHVFSMEFSPFQTYACCFSIKNMANIVRGWKYIFQGEPGGLSLTAAE